LCCPRLDTQRIMSQPQGSSILTHDLSKYLSLTFSIHLITLFFFPTLMATRLVLLFNMTRALHTSPSRGKTLLSNIVTPHMLQACPQYIKQVQTSLYKTCAGSCNSEMFEWRPHSRVLVFELLTVCME
jgi:hypothetical protein